MSPLGEARLCNFKARGMRPFFVASLRDGTVTVSDSLDHFIISCYLISWWMCPK